MKKKAEGMSLRETFAIHRRAARDMRRIAPGCFMPFILCAVVYPVQHLICLLSYG